jgi:Tol biopolymer transport system component
MNTRLLRVGLSVLAILAAFPLAPVEAAPRPLIAFYSVNPEDFLDADIHILFSDQTVSGPLQPDGLRPMGLTISPDGSQIAFSTWGPECFPVAGCLPAPPSLYIVNVDGSGLQRIFVADESINTISEPDWSPDGGQIMFSLRSRPDENRVLPNADVSVVTRDALGRWSAPVTLLGREGHEESAEWSPDGSRIVYAYDPNPKGGYDYEHGDEITSAIWTSDADGSGPHMRVTPRGGYRSSPTFSPDGRWIAYVAAPSMWSKRQWDIRAVRTDGTRSRLLVDHRYESWGLDFSPDGSSLAVGEGYGLAGGRIMKLLFGAGSRTRVLYDSPEFEASPRYFPVP